ncbi:MAG: EamA family transporter [Flavobacteriaceae bacterium]|nr:EamA family transporter [Flavobacteriaceae bacterium]
MIYLAISILLNSLLFVIFKLFLRYQINSLQAIITNYVVAAILGYGFGGGNYDLGTILNSQWLIGSLILGLIFISTFLILAKTTQNGGLTMASIASKMSVVIPVIFAFVVYNDQVQYSKLIGIIIALIAVYLTSTSNQQSGLQKNQWHLPVLLFLGAGILDTLLKYIEQSFVPKDQIPHYSATIFASAFLFGFLYKITFKRSAWELKSILAGILLGIPNYFSIYFLIKALQFQGLESSVVFPINNIGVVLITSLIGFLIFKETLETKNWLGIILSIIAILLIGFSV